jgi:hypothetical protein
MDKLLFKEIFTKILLQINIDLNLNKIIFMISNISIIN